MRNIIRKSDEEIRKQAKNFLENLTKQGKIKTKTMDQIFDIFKKRDKIENINTYTNEIEQVLKDNEEDTSINELWKGYITDIQERRGKQKENIEKNTSLLIDFMDRFSYSSEEKNKILEEKKETLKDIYPTTLDKLLQILGGSGFRDLIEKESKENEEQYNIKDIIKDAINQFKYCTDKHINEVSKIADSQKISISGKRAMYINWSDEECKEMGITTQKVNTAFAFLKDRTAEEKEFLITEETSHLDFVDDREKQEVLQKEELNKYEQKIIILGPKHLPNFEINRFRKNFKTLYETIKENEEKEIFDLLNKKMSYLFLETNQETLDWIFAIIEKKTPLKSIKKIIDVLGETGENRITDGGTRKILQPLMDRIKKNVQIDEIGKILGNRTIKTLIKDGDSEIIKLFIQYLPKGDISADDIINIFGEYELVEVMKKGNDIDMIKLILKSSPKEATIENIKELFNGSMINVIKPGYTQKEELKKILQNLEENQISPDGRRYFFKKILGIDNRSGKIQNPKGDVKTFRAFCDIIKKRIQENVDEILNNELYDIYIGQITQEDIAKMDEYLQVCEKESFTKEKKMVFFKNLIRFRNDAHKTIMIDVELFNLLYDIMQENKEDEDISNRKNIGSIITTGKIDQIEDIKEIIKKANKEKIAKEEIKIFLKYGIEGYKNTLTFGRETAVDYGEFDYIRVGDIDVFKRILDGIKEYTQEEKIVICDILHHILSSGRLYSSTKEGNKYLDMRIKEAKELLSKDELLCFIRLGGIYLDNNRQIRVKDIKQFDKTYKKIKKNGLGEEFDIFLEQYEGRSFRNWKDLDVFMYILDNIDIKQNEKIFEKIYNYIGDNEKRNMIDVIKLFMQGVLKNVPKEKKREYLNELKETTTKMANKDIEKIKENISFIVKTYLKGISTKEKIEYIKALETGRKDDYFTPLGDMKKSMFSMLYNYLPIDMQLGEKFSILGSMNILGHYDEERVKKTIDTIKPYIRGNNYTEILNLGENILVNSNEENLVLILDETKKMKGNIINNLKKMKSVICNGNTKNIELFLNEKTITMDERGELEDIICNGKPENLELILDETKKMRGNMINNLKKMKSVICNGNTKNIELFLSKTTITIDERGELQDIIQNAKPENLEIIIDKETKNKDELVQYAYILKEYKSRYLEALLDLFGKQNITTLQKTTYLKNLKPICENNGEYVKDFIKNIKENKKGFYYGYFAEAVKNSIEVSNNTIHRENFLEYMDNKSQLFTFKQDSKLTIGETTPWTKKWFLEKPERKEYLKPETMSTFRKFGTIVGLGILEGAQNANNLKKFYKYIFTNISEKESRSSILQLGEVFSVLLKNGKYDILDEIVDKEVNIGEEFKTFIEKYKISDKGRTILTLMIAREINSSFVIWNKDGETITDTADIKKTLLGLFDKFKRYEKIINRYENIPIKTSIGVEYEVTNGIANGYKNTTKGNYKNDIEILSAYGNISKGNDAVHEIATKPTDNPYLLLLEIKLLEDLDFLDLNFKKEDYAQGARTLHITIGGEYGIIYDKNTDFIQNILNVSNIGGINLGEDVERINRFSNIRAKGMDCEAIFLDKKTECTEYRALDINKSEQFERLLVSIFNLNMAKQAVDKYIKKEFIETWSENRLNFTNNEEFKKYATEHDIRKEQIEDENIYTVIYEFLDLQNDVLEIVDDHNKNFLANETISINNPIAFYELIHLIENKGDVMLYMEMMNVDIKYLSSLIHKNIKSEEEFFEQLKNDGKDIDSISEDKERHTIDGGKMKLINAQKMVYSLYKTKFKPALERLETEAPKVFENISQHLENQDIDEIERKRRNRTRLDDECKKTNKTPSKYIKNIQIDKKSFFEIITPELVNKFTHINNFFLKEDSINASSMFDATKENNGTTITDRKSAETTIFDKIDQKIQQRNGYNYIEGASEKMITQAIQKRILEFNEKIFQTLHNRKNKKNKIKILGNEELKEAA